MRHFEKENPTGEGYVLVPEKQEEEMLEVLGATYHLEKVFRTERRSCDLRDEVCFYKFKQMKLAD